MVTILRKIKVKFYGNYEIKHIDKNKYYIVVAIKEIETSRDYKGWCFGKCDILFYGIIDNTGKMIFLDAKECLVNLG